MKNTEKLSGEEDFKWRCFFGIHLYGQEPVKAGEWSKGGVTYTSERGEYRTLRCNLCGSEKTFYSQARFSEI